MDKPIFKPSTAPAPMTPLRGSSPRAPSWKKADWNHWVQMPYSSIWNLVALSLDLEPSNSKNQVREWPPEYDSRLQITLVHVKCGSLVLSKFEIDSVDISTFGTWAQLLGWSLPEIFPIGAKTLKVIESSKDKNEWTFEELEELHNFHQNEKIVKGNKAFKKTTGEKFGISPTRVYQLLEEYEKKKPNKFGRLIQQQLIRK